jgi:hypothetical protein
MSMRELFSCNSKKGNPNLIAENKNHVIVIIFGNSCKCDAAQEMVGLWVPMDPLLCHQFIKHDYSM